MNIKKVPPPPAPPPRPQWCKHDFRFLDWHEGDLLFHCTKCLCIKKKKRGEWNE